MKKLTTAVVAGLWVMGAAVALADSPHMGTWKLDEAKSDIPAGMTKNTKVVYTTEGDNWKITTEGTDNDGRAIKTTWVGKIDGKPYAIEGNSAYDHIAYTKKNERTNELKTMKDGKVIATGSIVVAPDGKSRVVTVTMTGEDGKKMTSKAAYNKE
jgi:VCBS repeat-containing protein